MKRWTLILVLCVLAATPAVAAPPTGGLFAAFNRPTGVRLEKATETLFAYADTPLTPLFRLGVRTDENGALLVSAGTPGSTDGPLTTFPNLSGRTDENGYLKVAFGGGVGTLSRLTLSGTTVAGSATTSFLDISGVWNTNGAPTGIKLNVTESGAGSAASSLLMDLQVGGASKASISKAGNVQANSYSVGAGGYFAVSTRANITASADGVINLYNTTVNGFTRLNFGGTTNAFPALAVSGNMLHVKKADDSGLTGLAAAYVSTAQVETSSSPNTNGFHSVTCSGTSPARTCVVQIYDGGALRTIATMTY
jgi:hypothetical protein